VNPKKRESPVQPKSSRRNKKRSKIFFLFLFRSSPPFKYPYQQLAHHLILSHLSGEPNKRPKLDAASTPGSVKKPSTETSNGKTSVRKLSPEEIEARKRRAAELNAVFGGININKSTLKEPDRPVDLEKAKAVYEKKLIEELEMLKQKRARLRAAALARKQQQAQNGSSKASNGKSAPRKPQIKKPEAPKTKLSVSELEKRIQALKAQMTPGTAKAAAAAGKAASNTTAGSNVKIKPEEDDLEDDDLDGLFVAIFWGLPLCSQSDYLCLTSLAEEDEDEDDGFVVSDDDDWRSALRSVTKYDPRKFQGRADDDDDDAAMEAGWNEIDAEEKKTARIGRMEDEEEERKERLRQKLRQKK
jgi:hypothetical protein